MWALLKDEGKQPEDREVTIGRLSGVIACRREEGIGSRAQVVGRWESRSWETSESVRGEKVEREEEWHREGDGGCEGAADVCEVIGTE